MSWFAVASWTAWALCSLAAGLLRGRLYGTFLAVVLGLYTLIGVAVLPHVHAPLPLLWFLHGCAYLQWLSLIAPSMRPAWFRWGVSLPGLYTSAGVLLAFPWAISIALGLPSWGVELPFVLAAVGLVQSLSARVEVNRILVGGGPAIEGIQRVAPLDSSSLAPSTGSAVGASGGARRELKLVQLTDTHLGPFMPVERLAGVCRRAVEADPDLVLLTGDFLTMESQSDARYLTAALAPLRALEGRVFAC
ncbi:MAG TPA: phosphodiesterase, partial [Polyangiaceae bacterium]|nr:phosphodiesterase [Polyangiaceae bacterium]